MNPYCNKIYFAESEKKMQTMLNTLLDYYSVDLFCVVMNRLNTENTNINKDFTNLELLNMFCGYINESHINYKSIT